LEHTTLRPIFLKDSHIHATPEVLRKYKYNSHMAYNVIS
jgi:hypothetical protein